MKKLLSLLMMSLLCVAAWAGTVTFTFNTVDGLTELGLAAPDPGAATNLEGTYTLDGVTMSFTSGGTATRIWNSQGGRVNFGVEFVSTFCCLLRCFGFFFGNQRSCKSI